MGAVLMHIKGSQIHDGEVQTVEFTTQGMLECDQSGYTLSYQDSEIDSEDDTLTEIRVDKHTVSMRKTGNIETFFLFEQEKTYQTTYQTPLGVIEIALYPTLVNKRKGETGGTIELEYVLNIAGSQIVNHLSLDYVNRKSWMKEETKK